MKTINIYAFPIVKIILRFKNYKLNLYSSSLGISLQFNTIFLKINNY